jgi:cobalt-zinc-cadmium efflux system membrane fusion protein
MTSDPTRLIARLCLAFGACLLAACGGPGSRAVDPAGRPAAFTLSPAQRERIRVESIAPTAFHRTVEVTGTVAFDADHATQVIAPISGPVSRLLVSVGAHVTRGEPLAAVASPDFAAAVSGYRKADAAARNARRIADLDTQLFANDAISRRETQQAETDAIAAEADRDAALQQLRSLGAEDATIDAIRSGRPVSGGQGLIRSPLAGTVVERLITPGQLLQAGATPCFTVADMTTVWVMANVFESDLADVALGNPAEILPPAGHETLVGKVGYISDLVNPDTRAVAVRVVTPNPKGVLKKDMYVQVAISSRTAKTGLLVPVSAVLRDAEDLPFVYLENGDGTFARRRVTIGDRVGDRQDIASGLASGDRVVVEGGLFMQFAQSQ